MNDIINPASTEVKKQTSTKGTINEEQQEGTLCD